MKKKPIALIMPPTQYNIEIEKLSNEVSVKWAITNNNRGESMSIRFQTELQFFEFCDIMGEAAKMYAKKYK